MQRFMLKSKIFRATVTDANLLYEGSLALGPELRQAADMLPGEKVLVVNCNNGERFETYVLEGKPGEVCLNGAAARLGQRGDIVIVMTFAAMEEAEARAFRPRVVHVDAQNRVTRVKE